MRAVIITIGNELLIGQVQDTNSGWIAGQLANLGITVTKSLSVPDTDIGIREALSAVEGATDLVIMTGGLGPTSDDITRQVLTAYFETEPVFNEAVFEDIRSFLERRGRTDVSPSNRAQAYVPRGATVLRNPIGTAPGTWVERGSTVFVSLPGVPFEMKELMNSSVLPLVRRRFSLPSVHRRTVLVHGIPEADLADHIADWESGLKNIELAYLPSPGQVRLRLTAADENREAATQRIQLACEGLSALLKDEIFGYDDDTMEAVVGSLLRKKGATAATAESCTGGAIAARITRISGASDYFKGGVVAYANEIKTGVLGVPREIIDTRGAVSRETVEAMAQGARRLMETDYAVAVSGIAGPSGGTPEKPVGTVWIAAASNTRTVSERFRFGERRDTNIDRTVISALNMLRKLLIEESDI